LQCKDNFNYFNGNCVVDCPKHSFKSMQNICLNRDEECDEQCEKCESGKCANCHVGFYLFQGKCLSSCPVGYRANRINFTCLLSKEFSFYWVYPSRQSCDQKCGDNTNTDCR
jgi:proprotein convertase subtilisin/kexin type 5